MAFARSWPHDSEDIVTELIRRAESGFWKKRRTTEAML
jgi:hypothetical protein